MKDEKNVTAHWSFWLICSFMLLWNVMGCINFALQMNPGMISSYRESEQAIIEGRPVWATAAFAIAVFGGALGCLMLIFKKSSTFYIFIVSFLGVVVTQVHTLNLDISLSTGEIAGFVFMPAAVAAFLVWYSKYAEHKGWIGN